MKRLVVFVATALLVGLVVQASSADPGHKDVLAFRGMVAVDGPFVGATNPIRTVPGGGLPWQIDRARGELGSDGSLRVSVEGLVLLDGPPVPEDLQGTNPVPSFLAIVSCLTSVNGAFTTTNVATAPFAASPDGDAIVRTTVALPDPCVAPIVFVTSPTGAWFASTGA